MVKFELILTYTALTLLTIILCFPIFWMVTLSLRPYSEIFTPKPVLVSPNITLEHYIAVFKYTNFPRYLLSSMTVSLFTTIICVAIGTLGGYSLARFKFIGSTMYSGVLLFILMFPEILVTIPVYILMRNLGLLDTYFALILIYTAFYSPFSVWSLKNYVRTIPVEIEESASLDGCTRLGVILRVTFPLLSPGMIASAIYVFITTWGEFIIALTIITSENVKTLPIGLSMLFGQYTTEWGMIMAASVMYTLPVVLLFAFFQRYFITGLTSGAIKA